MSTAENKALIRRMFDAQNEGNIEATVAALAPDAVIHFPGLPEPIRGREGFYQIEAPFRQAMPDYRFTEEDMIAEGDRVVARWRIDATNLGAFQGIPASGKRLTLTSIDIFRIANGQVAEMWTEMDMMNFLQQIGAAPAPNVTPA